MDSYEEDEEKYTDTGKFAEHTEVINMLKQSQDADEDKREDAREALLFVNKKDGQWEPYWWTSCEGRPRYTFDMTSPVIDLITGEMEQADFNISVQPAGGDVTKDDAAIFDGLIRNIENLSNANDTFNRASRNVVTGGIDGWCIKQKYVDDDSFEQDLVIEAIPNFLDSVWFGPHKTQTAQDADWVVVLEAMNRADYEDKYPESSGMSVSDSRTAQAYFDKHDQVVIGNIYYKTYKKRTLLKMRSGKILEEEAVKDVLDEMAAEGDIVVETRERHKCIVKSRLFDGGGWLNDEEETAFNHLPVIPMMANFDIFENKVLYRGAVEKMLDAQRVFNYAKSRQIEEGALAPRAKYFMTEKQTAGHEETLATMNTNADPVQHFNPDPENPGPPQQNGGAQVNPGLATISEDMRVVIQQTANMFAASMGDNPGLQSGVAIKSLQDKGDTGTIKYFKAREIATSWTARILIDTIPTVYSTERQIQIIDESGSSELKVLNEPKFDEETGKLVVVNDISKGKFNVTCSAGPSFQNRQQETIHAMTEIAQVDPSVIELGGDIMFNNMTSPGMDLLAERKRKQLFENGLIPTSQLTDEEQQLQMQAQQQPPEPSPEDKIAQAEIMRVEAEANAVGIKAEVAQRREDREDFIASNKMDMEARKTQVEQERFETSQFLEMQKQQDAQRKQIVDMQKTMAETAKLIREAMGIEAIPGEHGVSVFAESMNNLDGALDQRIEE